MLPLFKHILICLQSKSTRGPRGLFLLALFGFCLLSTHSLVAQNLESMPWVDQESGEISPTGLGEREAALTRDRESIPEAVIKKKPKTAPATARAPLTAPSVGLGFMGTVFVYGFLGIAVLVLIGLLVWIVMNSRVEIELGSDDISRPDRSIAESIRHLPFEMDVTKGDFRQQAQAAYQSGNFRMALIFLFSHVLVTLDQAKLVRLKKGKTNRQYLRELSDSPPLVRYYGDVMVPFEQTFFGDYPVTKEVFDNCWRGLDDFQSTVKAARTKAAKREQATDGKSLAVGSQLTCWFLIVCLSTIAGCGGNSSLPVETKYGKVNEQPLSINSTSLFAERLEELGYDVTVRNRISPKIDEFGIVFWFPENIRCPSDEATKAIEEWMDTGYGSKTLVYVGADYRADEDYYQAAQKRVSPELKAESQRLLSEAQLATQNRRNNWQDDFWPSKCNTACDWFDIEVIKPRKHSNLLAGPMADNASFSTAPKLPVEVMMAPKKSTAKWAVESLLTVDGEDMVYRLADNNSYSNNQIIVVQNGSFLVNFAAADPNKQSLADQLVAEATSLSEDEYGFGYGFSQQVLILESESEIPVRNTDFVNQNSWAWIAEEPLCYIVPLALLWGVLFCFVYFPIFGRPKRTPKRSTATFRNHINAIAKQLSKSSSKEHARRTIEQYQESISGSNKKKS